MIETCSTVDLGKKVYGRDYTKPKVFAEDKCRDKYPCGKEQTVNSSDRILDC